ncbi:MAG: hypothetical protein C0424_12050 [Sphingobacteriaceae bacterium]|nr:hypothetical protein [Sphingobacteriaceae bacterium]
MFVFGLLAMPVLAQDDPAQDGPEPELTEAPQQAKIRPFNTYERFSYEAGISNQLQNMMSRYLKSNLFAISVQIEGRMVSAAAPVQGTASAPSAVKGKPSEGSGEDKTVEMLPALPFFSSRLRAPVEVENPEVKDAGNKPVNLGGSTLVTGPQIDKIRVIFVLDTAITPESANFYKGIITSALRLDSKRGDEILISNAAFPRSDDTDATQGPPVVVNAQIAPNTEQNTEMKGFIAQLTKDLTLQILVAMAVLGLLIFIGLVWRGRNKSELSVKGKDARNLAQELNAGGGGLSEQAMGNMANMMGGMMNMNGGSMRMQTEMVMSQDSQQMELNQSDPLMNWLVNDKENLAFAFERWLREMGPSGVHKIILLLYPYGHSFFEMICEQMGAESVDQLEAAWMTWKPNDNDAASRQRTMDELVLAMKNQRQFGHFPFIIHLKDREIVDLLKDEEPLESLMVVNGLNSNRKSNLLNMLGTEKTALILASFPELSEKRFGDYADLSSRLFTKLKDVRERSKRNEKAFEQVLATIEQQSMGQQEEMVENLRDSNEEMYRYIRERITLWSDVAEMPESVLRDAMTGLDSEALAAIVAKDEALEKKLLPLRPAREQALVRDLIAQGAYSPEATEMERKKFLNLCRQLNALLEKTT